MGVSQVATAKEVMTEEETNNVALEEPAVVEATESESQPEPQGNAQEDKRRKDEAYNWAESNRVMKEMKEQNKALAEQLKQLQKPPVVEEVDELDRLADDDILTKGQAKKLNEKMARQAAQDAIRQYQNSTVDDRLQAKFPDFADVVTQEAIEELKQTEPELAFSLSSTADPYAQGVAAYKLLKKMGKVENMADLPEKKKALQNSQKPVSVNSVVKNSAIGNAHLFENGLTPELKQSLWKEMQEARKRM
jgi:hypothetical protein